MIPNSRGFLADGLKNDAVLGKIPEGAQTNLPLTSAGIVTGRLEADGNE
jgi:hypothetical protein